jgi:CDP-paratose 2-epimerase
MMPSTPNGPIAIVGGSGFIGSNLADSLLASGGSVVVIDNLSRADAPENLAWLKRRHNERMAAHILDIRDMNALAPALLGVKAVFHLAAQTSATASLIDPREDFAINAGGTLNLLEAIRQTGRRIPFIFASTNKVYGSMDGISLDLEGRRVPTDATLAAFGINEGQPLDFCTPYACSKGVADQYVLNYGRTFGLPTIVLRMGCIYGPRQFGTEDRGWVAHFLLRALAREPVTVYGDGNQVRDILHVSDAIAACRRVLAHIDGLKPRAFNLGGGPANAVSLIGLLAEISRIIGRRVEVRYADSRAGDQAYFVADTRSLTNELGWRARIGWREGLKDLVNWLRRNRKIRRSAGNEMRVA